MCCGRNCNGFVVALRKESVDRNGKVIIPGPPIMVALRKESVDRNGLEKPRVRAMVVALRKESVDRNLRLVYMLKGPVWSLSARRAWIEMPLQFSVAVDRLGRSPQGERG